MPADFAIRSLLSLNHFWAAVRENHPTRGVLLIKFSANQVIGAITSWIGPVPEVSDHLINSRIKNIVKKKRMRSVKMDFPSSPMVLKRLSFMVTELTHWMAKVAVVPFAGTLIETPFGRSIVD